MNANDAVRTVLDVIKQDNDHRRERLATQSRPRRVYTEAQIVTTEKIAGELRQLVASRSGGLTEQDLKPLFARWKLEALKAFNMSYGAEKAAFLGSRTQLGTAFSYVVVQTGLERMLANEAPAPKETVPA